MSAAEKRRWRASLAVEAHWVARLSCLMGALALWVDAMRWAHEGRSLLSVATATVAGAGCVIAWNLLGRVTAADLGLPEDK